MAPGRSLIMLASAAGLTSMLAGPAWTDEPKIEGFLSDPIEVYDQDEDYIDDYDVGGIALDQIKVLDESGDMVKLDFGGGLAEAWVFKTDIKWPAGCREAAVSKVAKAKNASTMGLGGDLCE